MKKILIVAAHPDDEVLGAGVAIASHVADKDDVFVLILGEGVSARYAKRSMAPKALFLKLRAQSKKALRSLGVTNVLYEDLPDNRFDSVDFLDVVKKVESVISRVKPEVIYTHHAGDLNYDHQITCRAVLTASRPFPGQVVKRILSFEVLSSTEWNFSQQPCSAFTPTVFLDARMFLNAKMAAFKFYESEAQDSDSPRSIEGIRRLAEYRGRQVGLKCAEAYQLLRDIQ